MSEEAQPLTQDAPTRDVLNAAWDHLEKFEREQAPAEPAPKPAPTPAPAPAEEKTPEELDRESVERGAKGRDSQGRFTREPRKAAPREAQPEAVSPPPPAPAAPAAFRAPQSWRPVEREALEKSDPVVQQAVLRREQEMARGLQQSAPQRKFVEEWSKTVQPFESMIRAAGQTPLGAIHNLLSVAQAMQTQPVPMRAQILLGLMRSYGVTPQDLGQAITTGGSYQQQQPMQDPRVDQLYGELAAWRESQQQGIAAAEDAALEEFSKTHPWLDDLADVMSDMMRVGAERGTSIDYEEAYRRALTLRPDLLEIDRQRSEETARTKNAPTPNSRNAALGIRGSSRVIARPKKAPETTREAASLAWDSLTGDGRM